VNAGTLSVPAHGHLECVARPAPRRRYHCACLALRLFGEIPYGDDLACTHVTPVPANESFPPQGLEICLTSRTSMLGSSLYSHVRVFSIESLRFSTIPFGLERLPSVAGLFSGRETLIRTPNSACTWIVASVPARPTPELAPTEIGPLPYFSLLLPFHDR
jgi:hypothetical protein